VSNILTAEQYAFMLLLLTQLEQLQLHYRSWKYWHAAMLHAKSIVNVVAYDMYLECAEGLLDEDWKVDKPVSFHVFRETLARQMLAYDPTHLKYLGDDKFRVNTVQKKAKRARSPVPTAAAAVAANGDTISQTDAGITAAAMKLQGSQLRLCGFLGAVSEHFKSCQGMEDKSKKLTCVYCGKLSYQYCGLCGVAVHKFSKDGGPSCFFQYHDTGCFGSARSDWKITNKKQKDWTHPTMAEIKANEAQMKRLSAQVDKVPDKNGADNGDSEDDSSV
jgi:hypothetical protein